jgi:hypothetical protein
MTATDAQVTAVHAPGTEVANTKPGLIEEYRARIIMAPEDARMLDDQLRACTKAVLREGTDYGIIPGTSGEQTLWRPGAQKLLQWFGLGYTCERAEVERDDDGRKHGITYRATVARRLPDGSLDIKATCEGTADYDESKFCQSAEEVQRKAEASERMWAKKDRRVADPDKWKNRGEYRADWNALMKRAQKRAIVGAVVDATAAGGIFTDREEDDSPAPPPQGDGPAWYEQALEAALTFDTKERGEAGLRAAATAARDGLCTPRQATHIQNRIAQRVKLLKTATPVDVEDLGRQAAQQAAATPERPAGAVPDETPASGPAASAGPGTEAPEDQPGSASAGQLTSLHIILGGLSFTTADREQKLHLAETITGRAPLTGPAEGRSSKNLSFTEARKLTDTLSGFGGDREKLIAWMAEREQAGDSGA